MKRVKWRRSPLQKPRRAPPLHHGIHTVNKLARLGLGQLRPQDRFPRLGQSGLKPGALCRNFRRVAGFRHRPKCL